MTEPDILYPAIFVFSMLLIGLLLTMWEFSRLQKSARARAEQQKPVTGRPPEQTGHRIKKASGF
jgi:hypothetical protein